MRAGAILCLILALGAAPGARAQQSGAPLRQAALAYALFQDDATVIRDADVSSVAAMDLVLARAARHDRDALARGFVAYGALSAAQSRAFRDGVMGRVRAAGRSAVLRQLRRDLSYARRRPPGAAEAVGIVLAMAAADGARLDAIALRYDYLGRRLQSANWGHPSDAARAVREARLRALAAMPEATPQHLITAFAIGPASASPLTDARAFGGRHFWDALSDAPFEIAPAQPAQRIRTGREGAIDRMLTLGALFIVGADEDEATRVAELLDDEPTRDCLQSAQLTFRQCASVAYGADEDAFCLARHGLRDPGACFASLAAAP